MCAIDVASEDDDKVTLVAQIVGKTPALALIEGGKLAAEMLAHREQPLLRLARRVEGWHCGAGPAGLHEAFEKTLLARAQLDAVVHAVQFRGRGIGADQLVEPIARAPAPSFGSSQVAQHGRQNCERHQALLPVDYLEQPRLALARFR